MEETQTSPVQNTQPQPSQPQGAPPEKKSGCLKWALIGCGTLLVLFILAGIGCYIGSKYVVKYGAEKVQTMVEEQLISKLPEGSQEREQARQALKDAIQGLQEGRVDPQEMSNFSELLTEITADEEVDKDEVMRIVDYMQRASADESTAELGQ